MCDWNILRNVSWNGETCSKRAWNVLRHVWNLFRNVLRPVLNLFRNCLSLVETLLKRFETRLGRCLICVGLVRNADNNVSESVLKFGWHFLDDTCLQLFLNGSKHCWTCLKHVWKFVHTLDVSSLLLHIGWHIIVFIFTYWMISFALAVPKAAEQLPTRGLCLCLCIYCSPKIHENPIDVCDPC